MTPSLGTSICSGCGPGLKKKKESGLLGEVVDSKARQGKEKMSLECVVVSEKREVLLGKDEAR